MPRSPNYTKCIISEIKDILTLGHTFYFISFASPTMYDPAIFAYCFPHFLQIQPMTIMMTVSSDCMSIGNRRTGSNCIIRFSGWTNGLFYNLGLVGFVS